MKHFQITKSLAAVICLGVPGVSLGSGLKNALKHAKGFIAKKNYPAAIAVYDNFLADHPTNPVALSAKADVYILTKDYQQAIALAERAHTISPTYDWPLAVLRTAYLKTKDFDSAERVLALLKPLLPEEKYLTFLGGYYHSKGEFSEAEEQFGQARTISQSKGLLEISAWNFKRWRKPIENEQILLEMRDIYPFYTRVHTALAFSYKDRADHLSALQALETAILLCEIEDSCDQLEEEGIKKYILSGPMSGFYLGESANAISGAMHYKPIYLSTENLIRITQISRKSMDLFEDLTEPRKNQVVTANANFVNAPSTSSPKKISVFHTQAEERGHSYGLNHNTRIRGETFLTDRTDQNGDIHYNPYLEYGFTNANFGYQFDELVTGRFSYDLYTLGLKIQQSDNYSYTRHQLNIAGKYGQTRESRSKFGILFAEYTYKDGLIAPWGESKNIPWWVSVGFTHTKRFTSVYHGNRWSLKPNAILPLSQNSSLYLSQEMVYHREFLGNRDPIDTNVSISTAAYNYTLGQYAPKAKIQYSEGMQHDSYNALSWDLSCSRQIPSHSSRHLGGKDFNYLSKSIIELGIKNVHMTDMARHFHADLFAIYAGITLFK